MSRLGLKPSAADVWTLKRAVPFFMRLADAELAALMAGMTQAKHRADDPIAMGGDVLVIRAGRARMRQVGHDGREVTLDFLEPGHLLGVVDAEGVLHATELVAVTETTVCRLARADVDALLAERPELMVHLARMIETRHTRLQRRFQHLLFADVRSRLLQTLAYLAETYGEPVPGGVKLALRLTHHDLAHLIGATREPTSQAIAKLRAEGLLAFEEKRPILLTT